MNEKNLPWMFRKTTILALFAISVAILGTVNYVAAQRRGDKAEPIVTWEKAPGDFTDISWAALPLPVDGVDAVALASPERTAMAGEILANLMSDPVWRAWASTLFRDRLKAIKVLETATDEEREEAAAWARDHAVRVPLAFADALIEAAGG